MTLYGAARGRVTRSPPPLYKGEKQERVFAKSVFAGSRNLVFAADEMKGGIQR